MIDFIIHTTFPTMNVLSRSWFDGVPFRPNLHIERRRTTLLRCPAHCIASALGYVHCQPDDQTRHEARGKEEGETIPGVARLVNDSLDDVRADDR
jgi:hypothetical protein